jgi:hypothetical protein
VNLVNIVNIAQMRQTAQGGNVQSLAPWGCVNLVNIVNMFLKKSVPGDIYPFGQSVTCVTF